MTRRTGGLGKGLDALIPRQEKTIPEGETTQVPVERISANPRQPRSAMDPEELTSLADSIREHGILQPLVVRRDPGSENFILIAGERRLRAAQQAGLKTVPVVFRQATDEEQLELALIENLQRSDLNPLETAQAYRQLINEFGLSQEQVAHKVGRSRSKVANTLRLFDLPPLIQQALVDGKITEGHAIALLMLKTPEAQLAAYHVVIERGLTVRETEELVRKLSGNRPVRRGKTPLPADIRSLEERIRESLGTRVTLRHSQKGHGSLSIYYFSEEELDALVHKLLNE